MARGRQRNTMTPKQALQLQQASEVWKLRIQGANVFQIATALSISTTTVQRRLIWAESIVRSNMTKLADDITDLQLDRTQYLFNESVRSWEDSKRRTLLVDEQGESESLEQGGDIKYLGMALQVVQEQNKMLGLHKATNAVPAAQVQVNVDARQVIMEGLTQEDRMKDIAAELVKLGVLALPSITDQQHYDALTQADQFDLGDDEGISEQLDEVQVGDELK